MGNHGLIPDMADTASLSSYVDLMGTLGREPTGESAIKAATSALAYSMSGGRANAAIQNTVGFKGDGPAFTGFAGDGGGGKGSSYAAMSGKLAERREAAVKASEAATSASTEPHATPFTGHYVSGG